MHGPGFIESEIASLAMTMELKELYSCCQPEAHAVCVL
jgi:hypothetical protein